MSDRLIAVIGGSSSVWASVQDFEIIYAEETPWGKTSGPVRSGYLGDKRLLWLARHGEPHSIAPHRINYRANLYTLQRIGVTDIIALNTVGGITLKTFPGSLWLPDQLVDYTWGRGSSFYDGDVWPLRHIEFGEPFDLGLRTTLAQAASDCNIDISIGGVYGCTQGPRLETAAEILRMRRDGCDMVGMTAMPEAVLARELGLSYASLSMVVNMAAGISKEQITQELMAREASGCMDRIMQILERALYIIS